MSGLDPKLRRLIRHDVQAMHSYAIQDAVGMVKLDAMENPFSLPAELQTQLGQRLGALALNRYPDGRVNQLRAALAAHTGMPQDWDLLLGNGSDELISLLSLACAVAPSAANGYQRAAVLAPVPGFVMYAMSAALQGLSFHGVPLDADFGLDQPAMLAAIAEHRPAIVYLAYPNNPTANLWDESVMAAIIQAQGAQGGLVVLDEAYQPFAARSYLERILAQPLAHHHVLLLRTLSKFGLAGVRIGYLMGAQALIAELDKVRPPYNVSVLNYECALFALEHAPVFAAQAAEICRQREIIFQSLSALPGIQVWPSDANMILIRVGDADKTFERLKARSVLVKNVSKMHPLLAQCLRLTVGTAEENRQLLDALQHAL